MLTVAGSVELFPALSTALRVNAWSLPSLLTGTLAVVALAIPAHEAIPERASAHWNVSVTPLLFQPLAFAAGTWLWPMVGGVWSIRTLILWCASSFPALSTL